MRPVTFLLLAGTMALTYATFSVKHEARRTSITLASVEQGIAQREATLTRLETEWEVLNRPRFLEDKAQMLGLTQPPKERILLMSEFVSVLRTLDEQDAAGPFFVESVPPASGDGRIALLKSGK